MFNEGDRVIVPVRGIVLRNRSRGEMRSTGKKRLQIQLEVSEAAKECCAQQERTLITKDYEANEVQCYACEISPELRSLADKVITRMPDLGFIDEWVGRENIAYVLSYEPKVVRAGNKTVYADCCKVKPPFRAFMDYQYVITVYEPHVAYMSEAQMALLMWHELKHVPICGKFVPHDVEDFSAIVEEYGIHWSEPDADIPNILAGDDDG